MELLSESVVSSESLTYRPNLGSRDWSGLPDPAISLVMAGLSPSLSDLYSSARVCREWLAVFSACKRDFLWVLPPVLFNVSSARPRGVFDFYDFTEERLYRRRTSPKKEEEEAAGKGDRPGRALPDLRYTIQGSSHGCLMVAEVEARHDGTGTQPFDHLSIVDLFFSGGGGSRGRGCLELPRAPYDLSRSEVFMTAPLTSPLCVVLAFDKSRVQYWRPGESEWACLHLSPAAERLYELDQLDDYRGDSNDLMRFVSPSMTAIVHGKLYVLCPTGNLLVVDSFFPRPSTTVLDIKGLPGRTVPVFSVLESQGDILLVYDEGYDVSPHPDPQHSFVVRRLDLAARRWVRVRSLHGRALFLNGVSYPSFSCEATRMGDGGGDCIYSLCHRSMSMMVYYMEDGTEEHLPLPPEYNNKWAACFLWALPSVCYAVS